MSHVRKDMLASVHESSQKPDFRNQANRRVETHTF